MWKLLDSDSTKNYRLTCVSAKQLSEVLITSANFELKTSPADDEDDDDDSDSASDWDSDLDEDAYAADDLSSTQAARRAALLGNLSLLCSLKIAGCRSAIDVISAVALVGTAIRGLSLTELLLHCPKKLVGQVGAALSLAFPRLAKLKFKGMEFPSRPVLGAAAFPEACPGLHSVSSTMQLILCILLLCASKLDAWE